MLEKKLNSYLRLRVEVFQFFSRCFLFKEFSQTFLVTEIVISPSDSFSNGSSLLDIGLTTGILDEFFWFRLPIQFSPLYEYVFHKVAKNRIKKEEKETQ